MKERALETASNVQQASGEAVVLDTTGTGIPTVETHDGDSPNWQTMCRTAMAQADAYRDLVEDWKRLYHATKSQRDALAEALRDCEMLVEQQAERYPGDRDEAARLAKVRSALSTGGGK